MIWASLAIGTSGCPGSIRETEKSNKRIDLGKDLLVHDQDAAAETEFKKAVAYDPDNEEAYRWLGLVYVVRAEKNVRLIEVNECLSGTMAQGLRDQANEQMRTGEQYLTKATDLAPDYGDAWEDRAAVASYFQDWDKVIEHGQKAIGNLARLEKEQVALMLLGKAHMKKHDYPKASTLLLQSLQREPGYCVATLTLAQTLFETKEYEAALNYLVPLLDDPAKCHLQEMYDLAGQLYLRLHDPGEASKAFDTCMTGFSDATKSCVAEDCKKARAQLP